MFARLLVWMAAAAALPLAAHAQGAATTYDLVIAHVRAIDPESGLDAERNIGILGDKVAAVSTDELHGKQKIDGKGQVAAPGFIDLHSHAYGYETATYQALDGVTTRLELEVGVYPVGRWYQSKAGHELLNYGASVSHNIVRYALEVGGDLADSHLPGTTFEELTRDARYDVLIRQAIPPDRYAQFIPMLEAGLDDGAIGIGSGTQYAPGITRPEMLDLTRLASRWHECVFTHVRYGSLTEPGSTLEALQEQIANAAVSGGCVHIVHLNSMAMSSTPAMLELFHQARQHGVDISTEIYPWDASSDRIRSVIFDDGWEQRWGVTPADLESQTTGRRLDRPTFEALRAGTGEDGVLMHMNTEATLERALQDPLVLVASDSSDIAGPNDHPRSAGTFTRVLGHYVRQGTLSLSDAIRKMSLMPAQRLEPFVGAMRHKGRLQPGADADLIVFDAARVTERARYGDAKQASLGINYVLVNGRLIVAQGQVVKNVHPGRPVLSDRRTDLRQPSKCRVQE